MSAPTRAQLERLLDAVDALPARHEQARADAIAAITHSEGTDALPTPDLETPNA